MNKNTLQFIRFCIVGLTGAIVDLGIFNLLAILLGINIYFSRIISFILAVINNYLLNKYWTFKDLEKKIVQQFTKFLIISLLGLIFNLIIMKLFQKTLEPVSSELLRKNIPVITAIGIVFFWNYFANKYWTFKEKNGVKYT